MNKDIVLMFILIFSAILVSGCVNEKTYVEQQELDRENDRITSLFVHDMHSTNIIIIPLGEK